MKTEYVLAGDRKLAPAHPQPQTSPVMAAAFRDPPRLGVPNVAGLEFHAEAGTLEVATPPPVLPYEPTERLSRPSYQADFIRPTTSVYLNHRLIRPGPARFAKPVPAVEPGRIEGGPASQRMTPQPIFPGRVTAWPRAELRWPTFGET